MSVTSSWASRNNIRLWVGGKYTEKEIRERASEEVGLIGKKEWFGLGVIRPVKGLGQQKRSHPVCSEEAVFFSSESVIGASMIYLALGHPLY